MKIRCMKCEQVKELGQEELQEVSKFVESRKLRAVGFLKFLSLDMREVCKDGREHQWEFEQEFDKDVHAIAKEINDDLITETKCYVNIEDINKKIDELTKKKEEENQMAGICLHAIEEKKKRLINMTGNELYDLWIAKEKSTTAP